MLRLGKHLGLLIILMGYTACAKSPPHLMPATVKGATHTVQTLLEKGADAEERNDQGVPALTVAAAKGYTGTVQVLLNHGVALQTKDPTPGQTALYAAAVRGHSATVHVLLDAGADAQTKDARGTSVLLAAIGKGYTSI